jgi:2-oxoglutarate/2-oxoacid ferredoxin oxidoreductase subunit alpha
MSATPPVPNGKPIDDVSHATIRFAGDSGDGMQLTGVQFTNSSTVFSNDISTLPDFPAEIRAPAGTVYGVSGFQLQFGADEIYTPGDDLDTLVAMNPAALKVSLKDLKPGGILVVNEDGFTDQNLKLAGMDKNPLKDNSLDRYRLHPIPMTSLTVAACAELGLHGKDAIRCKNFFALGVVCWLYNRPLEPIIDYINDKFSDKELIRDSNIKVLKAGYYMGETQELFARHFRVRKAKLKPGTYRDIRGNQAVAIGLIAAAKLANKELFYGTYPITPATDILHELANHKNFGVKTFQAEDEIAAMCGIIGAAFGGSLAATATSGPGVALKSEGMGLAVMLELPTIIVNVQRGGPSTGLPTKVEQSDLFQAIFGRNGECPMPVLAAQSPADCFYMTIEAARIAIRHMTPVMLLTDGFIANSAEPWRVPKIDTLEPIPVEHLDKPNGDNGEFYPYKRDENLSRPWVLPGTPGLAHRIGGLEKDELTGNVCYVPENHQRMVDIRQSKLEKVADFIPEQKVHGEMDGEPADVLVVGWGSTYGMIRQAAKALNKKGDYRVANIQIRYLSPFPKNLGEILERYRDKLIVVPELNLGQLRYILRSQFLLDVKGINKVQGRPFTIGEIVKGLDDLMKKGDNQS